jgi:hypothetical protein
LLDASARIGGEPLLVQAATGNTSIKLTESLDKGLREVASARHPRREPDPGESGRSAGANQPGRRSGRAVCRFGRQASPRIDRNSRALSASPSRGSACAFREYHCMGGSS